jgi:hypothetical protein
MKITQEQLKQIIKEELSGIIDENEDMKMYSFVMQDANKIKIALRPIPVLKQYKEYLSYYDPSPVAEKSIVDSPNIQDLIYQMDLLNELIEILNNMKSEINSVSFEEVDKVISDLDRVSKRLTWGVNTIGAIDQRYEVEDMISYLAKMQGRKKRVLKNIDLNLTKLEAVKQDAEDLFLREGHRGV